MSWLFGRTPRAGEPRLRSRPALVVCAAACLTGCGGGAGPHRDAAVDRPLPVDPRAAICTEVEAGATAVGLTTVQTIFTQNCVICHGSGYEVDLRAGHAWANLVNQPAPASESCGGILVVPGDPASSYLYQKLTNPHPCTGSQMPRTDVFPDPLPSCVIALIEDWIAEGAPGGAADAGVDAPSGG
jgi:cytochrome c5